MFSLIFACLCNVYPFLLFLLLILFCNIITTNTPNEITTGPDTTSPQMLKFTVKTYIFSILRIASNKIPTCKTYNYAFYQDLDLDRLLNGSVRHVYFWSKILYFSCARFKLSRERNAVCIHKCIGRNENNFII